MPSSITEPPPAPWPSRPWSMTLATFGFAGPPIGVTLCLFGLWLGEAVGAPSGLVRSGLSGLSRLPGYWAMSYLAAPPALVSGMVMILAAKRFSKAAVAALAAGSAVVLSGVWYLCLVAALELMRSFSWRDCLIFAGLGGAASLACFFIAGRKAPKAVQPTSAVTQGAG